MRGYNNNLDSATNFRIFFNFGQNLQKSEKQVVEWGKLTDSIATKRNAVLLLGGEVINQIPNWLIEYAELEEKGHCSGVQSLILLIKYQTFLNAIYSICENYAYLASKFVPCLTRRSYQKQLSKLSKIRQDCPEYAEILEKNSWYSQVHIMRSEATHFFDGFVYINNLKRPGIIFRDMLHRRDGVGPETAIDIPDVEAHVNELLAGVDDYSKNLCTYLFAFIEDGFERWESCFMPNPEGQGFLICGE